jgi:hypothetical protein
MFMRGLSLSKKALLLLLVGTLIRVPTLVSPISEGYRNAQTATLTAGMIENGQLRLDPIAPWRGDLGARLTMELPLYNLATLAINVLPGIQLEAAGRLASLVFWILSFIALQALWRRTLPPKAAFWANLLFIFAPMNWYLSTAFMPETLLQLLAICFMFCVLDYACKSTWGAFTGLFLTGLLGLLVKFPSFVHLGLFAGFVLIDRQGWRSIFRPGLLLAAFFIAVCLFAWGECVKVVNEAYFSDWAGWANVIGFIRPETSRLSSGYWLPLAGYNVAFIATAAAIPFVGLGLWTMVRRFTASVRSRVWLYLLLSLLTSWLIWGKGAPAQNYYNLPNLVLFSALFGVGVAKALRWLGTQSTARWVGQGVCTLLIGALVAWGILGFRYLSHPDIVAAEAAEWVKTKTEVDDIIIYQPRHDPRVIDYEHQPLLSHLTERRTWIWTRSTPNWEKQRALETSTYLVVTNPARHEGWLEQLRQSLKGAPPAPPAPLPQESSDAKFTRLLEAPFFTAYRIEEW